jgi:hypothetical protein
MRSTDRTAHRRDGQEGACTAPTPRSSATTSRTTSAQRHPALDDLDVDGALRNELVGVDGGPGSDGKLAVSDRIAEQTDQQAPTCDQSHTPTIAPSSGTRARATATNGWVPASGQNDVRQLADAIGDHHGERPAHDEADHRRELRRTSEVSADRAGEGERDEHDDERHRDPS